MSPASDDRAPRRDSKWWGWGDPSISIELDDHAREVLRERVGGLEASGRASLEEVRLPDPEPLPRAVIEAAGDRGVFDSREDRLRHAAGRGYVDLLRLRAGDLEAAPDAVLLPSSAEQLGPLLEACAAEGVAVVPFGGGTSVVGGLEPLRGPHPRLVSLDTARLRSVRVDDRSLTATLGAGLRGPEAEAALAPHGLVLGHYPQSFQYATVGGFAATRSAGQASSGYGRFDALVSSLRLVAPAGDLRTIDTPHSAAGPSLREVALGSEGAFGVIPEVTVRVRPAPARRRYEAWIAEDFEAGAEIVRSLAQGPGLPDVVRVSDERESEVSLALSGPRGGARRAFDAYLRLRRRLGGCLIVVGHEGSEEEVARRRALSVRALRGGGAAYLGSAAGRAWEHGRYDGPYLRDALMDMGAMVDTLETAHSWSALPRLYGAVGSAIEGALAAQGTRGLVFCHLSHAYPDGASLYFTFIAAAGPDPAGRWRAVKRAASEAIVAAGGTITHHHAVGRDHLPYLRSEVGATGIEALRGLKERFDPAGIMNPCKLPA